MGLSCAGLTPLKLAKQLASVAAAMPSLSHVSAEAGLKELLQPGGHLPHKLCRPAWQEVTRVCKKLLPVQPIDAVRHNGAGPGC